MIFLWFNYVKFWIEFFFFFNLMDSWLNSDTTGSAISHLRQSLLVKDKC